MTQKIKVKLKIYNPRLWLRQFPNNNPVWGNCEFFFDPAEKEYDWLIIYNDFPESIMSETLQCPSEHTLLVTTEPLSIKSYGTDFTKQFSCVLTSQPEWSLPHKDRIFSQAALHWFIGWGKDHFRSYNDLQSASPENKNKLISTVCSSKQQKHTLHHQRYQFTQRLKEKLPELDVFGHGVCLMDDKAEALDDYRYHIAIENYQGEHHWSEKLSDAFLGLTLPFYFGCTNVTDYFPEESFIPIDITDPNGAYEIIRNAIDNNEYEKRLPYILEARRLVLEEYNFFAVVSREIEARHNHSLKKQDTHKILYSRRLLRRKKPMIALRGTIEKIYVRVRSILSRSVN